MNIVFANTTDMQVVAHIVNWIGSAPEKGVIVRSVGDWYGIVQRAELILARNDDEPYWLVFLRMFKEGE